MALSKPTGKLAFAHQSIAILEAAHKEDEALIRQMLEALDGAIAITMGKIDLRNAAIAAARARLEGKPCAAAPVPAGTAAHPGRTRTTTTKPP